MALNFKKKIGSAHEINHRKWYFYFGGRIMPKIGIYPIFTKNDIEMETSLGGVHFLHCIPGRMNFFGTAGNVSYPLRGNVNMFRTPKDDSSKCFIPPILPQA